MNNKTPKSSHNPHQTPTINKDVNADKGKATRLYWFPFLLGHNRYYISVNQNKMTTINDTDMLDNGNASRLIFCGVSLCVVCIINKVGWLL